VYCDASAIESSGRQIHFGPQIGYFSSEDLMLPELPDTTFSVAVTTENEAAHSGFIAVADGVRAGDDVMLDAHVGPTQLAPEDGAVVSPDTAFSWTRVDGAVYRLIVAVSDGDTVHPYAIVTTEPSARLPDLSGLDVSFPAGQALSWQAFAYEGLTVDGFAASGRYGSGGISAIRSATAAE